MDENINYEINKYLQNFCLNIYDIDNKEWEKNKYKNDYNDEDDVFSNIIEDIANIIGKTLYGSNYKLTYGKIGPKNKIFIHNKDKNIYFMISFKIDLNMEYIFIRYNILRNERYIKIKFKIDSFLLNNF